MTTSERSRRVTLAQVAELAGVSIMTASYTYNRPGRVSERARSQVLAAATQLGYGGPDPSAQALRRGSTRTLGVVLGEHLPYAFDDPAAVSFLAGIADVCTGHGYGMTIVPISGSAEDAQRITSAAVDGFILWTTADDDPVLAAVQATRRPVVIHGGPAVAQLDLVSIDNREAARAIGAIAFAGARRVAVVSQPLDRSRVSSVAAGCDLADVRFPVTRDRLAGYRAAAEAVGIAWCDVVVGVCSRNDAAEAERTAVTLLAAADRPEAIVAMSDQQAVGVVRAVRAAGLTVPEDVAVTGWDDTAIAARSGLTTVAQSLREQGAACARTVFGQALDSCTTSWSIVRRSSTRS